MLLNPDDDKGEDDFVYRAIETSFWNDPDVEKLSAECRLAFLYFITSPHSHVGGIYILKRSWFLEETGLLDTLYDTVCDTLSKGKFVFFDQSKNVVWVRNALRYQSRSPKIYKSVAKHLQTLHKSLLIKDFLNYYPDVLKLLKIEEVVDVDTLSIGFCTATASATDSVTGLKSSEFVDLNFQITAEMREYAFSRNISAQRGILELNKFIAKYANKRLKVCDVMKTWSAWVDNIAYDKKGNLKGETIQLSTKS